MAVVKGSKQQKMIVVPERPLLQAAIRMSVVLLLALVGTVGYMYGRQEGLSLKVEVVQQRDLQKAQLDLRAITISEMRRQIADLRLGEKIDKQATEEVRQTVETLQNSIAELNEEIRFYKGVMLPNVEQQGLRIEQLDVRSTDDPRRVRYQLLLTQVVDKHDFVQGDVEISLVGKLGDADKRLPLSEISDLKNKSIRFRFRYFQNIAGEMTLPDGFKPREVTVVARSTGRNARRLERKFEWQVAEG